MLLNLLLPHDLFYNHTKKYLNVDDTHFIHGQEQGSQDQMADWLAWLQFIYNTTHGYLLRHTGT